MHVDVKVRVGWFCRHVTNEQRAYRFECAAAKVPFCNRIWADDDDDGCCKCVFGVGQRKELFILLSLSLCRPLRMYI